MEFAFVVSILLGIIAVLTLHGFILGIVLGVLGAIVVGILISFIIVLITIGQL